MNGSVSKILSPITVAKVVLNGRPDFLLNMYALTGSPPLLPLGVRLFTASPTIVIVNKDILVCGMSNDLQIRLQRVFHNPIMINCTMTASRTYRMSAVFSASMICSGPTMYIIAMSITTPTASNNPIFL